MSRAKGEKSRFGIILQVIVFFVLAIMVSAILTYIGQQRNAEKTVKEQMESYAEQTADELIRALKEYPTYEWLLRYWYEYSDILDIEYDVTYRMAGTKTRDNCYTWNKRHPSIPLHYVTEKEICNMSKADQKLYAEIIYSWLITHINQIKVANNLEFAFCVVTDETCQSQFFLFSAGGEGAVRSSHYGDAFTLGTTRTVTLNQQDAMRGAKENDMHLAEAGDYVDYYVYLTPFDDRDLYIGLTFKLSSLNDSIDTQARRQTTIAIIYQVILLTVALMLLLYNLLRPLKEVQRNIRLYKTTKDSREVAENLAWIHTGNEIEQLAEDVVDLTQEMDDYMNRIESITAEKERIGTELELATKIQLSMLPSVFPPFPDRSEFDIFAMMKPAREVGGDFYDFRLIDDDHLYMTIADVSGKGIPAALFMMGTMIMLENNAKSGMSPAEILRNTNNSVCANNPEEMFVTVWLGILELSTGKMKAANAGHEYPVIRHPDGRFEIMKDKHGLVLGAIEGMMFSEYEIMMRPGTSLFLYTDGIPEATDSKLNMFGTDRMTDALNSAGGDSPEEIIADVRHAVDAFVKGAPQFDDMTMMCVTYRGKENTV